MVSFGEKYPYLVDEWSEDNPYTPFEVSYGSNKPVIWNGKCGHTWTGIAKNRGNGHDCPFCSGNRTLKSFNDLASNFPELVLQWSSRNPKTISPENLTTRSNKAVWWICPKCHKEWKARVADRTEGHGCPYCDDAKKTATISISRLSKICPDFKEEWSINENSENSSNRYKVAIRKRTYLEMRQKWSYKCPKCGLIWSATIKQRSRGKQCPACTCQQLYPGINDLATKHPEIIKEWDFYSNSINPSALLANSRRIVHWICENGHRWRAKISDRVAGNGCPICAVEIPRQERTDYIRKEFAVNGFGLPFETEDRVGILLSNYIPQINMDIELSDTYEGIDYRRENAKNWVCKNNGIKLIRIVTPGGTIFDNCLCIELGDDSDKSFHTAVADVVKIAILERTSKEMPKETIEPYVALVNKEGITNEAEISDSITGANNLNKVLTDIGCNSDYIPRILKVYAVYKDDKVFCNNDVSRIGEISLPYARRIIAYMRDELEIIAPVSGQGKGRYKFTIFKL